MFSLTVRNLSVLLNLLNICDDFLKYTSYNFCILDYFCSQMNSLKIGVENPEFTHLQRWYYLVPLTNTKGSLQYSQPQQLLGFMPGHTYVQKTVCLHLLLFLHLLLHFFLPEEGTQLPCCFIRANPHPTKEIPACI